MALPSGPPGARLDLGEDVEANEADENHGDAVAVQETAPRLAQRDDPGDHQPLAPRL